MRRMTIDEQIGAKVKKRRRQLHYDHEVAADHIGCSVSQIMRYEAGDTSLKPETLIRLAGLYGCKPGYFFEGIEG